MPIEGEAGVGYRLGQGFDLPPLMFTVDEARALVALVRMAQVWQDPVMAQNSQVVLGKILSVLPLAAGCEARQDFRNFRLDRMARVELLQSAAGRFADEPGKTLADYLPLVAPPEAMARLQDGGV